MFVALLAAVSCIPPRPLILKKASLKAPANDNGVGCTICKEVVRLVEDYLDDGRTQEEIEELIDQYCAKLPSPYDTLCKSLVDSYIPIIIEWLDQEMEVVEICTKIGLCDASSKSKVRVAKNAKNDIVCETCKQLVKYVESLLDSQTTKEEIIKLCEELCDKIPAPYGAVCDSLVESYMDQIIAWLEQEIEAADICKMIGLCTDAAKKIRLPKGAKNDVTCETCKQLVQYVESLLQTEHTKEEIIDFCKTYCDKIPAPYGAVCDTLVETYIDQIVAWIDEEIEAVDICKKIELCTDSVKKIRIPKGAKNDITCDTCTQLVQYVEALLQTETGKEEIIELCDQLCDKVPAPYGAICDSLVETYIDQIIEWIDQEIDSLEICVRLGICTGAKKARKASKNDMACDVCQQLVKYVEKLIESETTKEEIIKLCEELCDKIPAPYGAICDTLVETYIEQIIEWVEQEVESLEICQRIGLCPSASKKVRLPKGAKNDMACETCKQLVKFVENLLESQTAKEEIVKLCEELCDKIPAPYGAICDSLVEAYIDQIIEWVEQEVETLEICQRLGLCPTAKKVRLPKGAKNDVSCTVCKQVVALIEALMVEEKTEEEITSLVEKLCDQLPSPYGAVCDSLAESYIPVIMQWLDQEIEVLDICKRLGLCTDAKKVVRQARKGTLAARASSNGATCDVCQSFVKWAEKELEEYTVAALWKLVSVDCPKVAYIKNFCAILTESDIETILNLIIAKLTPLKICTWIKVC